MLLLQVYLHHLETSLSGARAHAQIDRMESRNGAAPGTKPNGAEMMPEWKNGAEIDD